MNSRSEPGAPSSAFFLVVALAAIAAVTAWTMLASPTAAPLFSVNDRLIGERHLAVDTPLIIDERGDRLDLLDEFGRDQQALLEAVDLNEEFILFATTSTCLPYQRSPHLVINDDGWTVRNGGSPDPWVLCEQLHVDVHAFAVERKYRSMFNGVPTS